MDRLTLAIDATEQICVEDLPIMQWSHLPSNLFGCDNKRTFEFVFNYIKDSCDSPLIVMMADGDKACRASCSGL